MKETAVVKRDGVHEPFDVEKIARVVRAAGLNKKLSEELSLRVERWFNRLKMDSITSLVIRDKVIEELKKADTYAANLYQWYQKSKEK